MVLPEYLKRGEDARFIPVAKDSNTEARLLSPVLAAMVMVPEFARTMLNPIGARVGKTTTVRALTEIVFASDDAQPTNRPDGLILLKTGKREYRLLVEAKAKGTALEKQQVETYLELARDNKVDAVLTISNEFSANATHSPLTVRPTLLRKVELFHFSWSLILTNVDLMLERECIGDEDRILIMHELRRYLSHHSTGVSGFSQMNKSWREIVKAFSSDTPPPKSDLRLMETIAAWHQEQKDLCLILSRHIGRHVSLKLPPKSRVDAHILQRDTLNHLLDSNCLLCELDVPDAPSTIAVRASLARKTISIAIKLKAPTDRKSARARSNWLMRQLNNVSDPRIQLLLHYPGKKSVQPFEIVALRENLGRVEDDSKIAPNYFEVRLHDSLGSEFSGSRKFIDRLEVNLLEFYAQAVAGVKPWTPSAPKPIESPEINSSDEQLEPKFPMPGDLN